MAIDVVGTQALNVRVVQKNLVYVIGIPQKFADEALLRRYDFFGQFGSIRKIIVNRRTHPHVDGGRDSRSPDPTASAYITFSSSEEATWCIEEVDESILDGNILRCTYGTTKYCSFFLKGIPCQNSECMYLHEEKNPEDVMTKDELIHTKHKLHKCVSKNKNRERIGRRKSFKFLEELLPFKSKTDFQPPSQILFEPMDFSEEHARTT